MWLWSMAWAGADSVAMIERPLLLGPGEVEVSGGSLSFVRPEQHSEVGMDASVGVTHLLEVGVAMDSDYAPHEPLALGEPLVHVSVLALHGELGEIGVELAAPLPLQGEPSAELGLPISLEVEEQAKLELKPTVEATLLEEAELSLSFPAMLLVQPHERLFLEVELVPPVGGPLEALALLGTTLGSTHGTLDLSLGGGGALVEDHFEPEFSLHLGLCVPTRHEHMQEHEIAEENEHEDDAVAEH